MKQKSEWKLFFTSVAGGWVPPKYEPVQPLDPTPPSPRIGGQNIPGLKISSLASRLEWKPALELTSSNMCVGLPRFSGSPPDYQIPASATFHVETLESHISRNSSGLQLTNDLPVQIMIGGQEVSGLWEPCLRLGLQPRNRISVYTCRR